MHDDGSDLRELEQRLREATIGEVERLAGPVRLVPYDTSWPSAYDTLAARIRSALGARVLTLEHAGSTSVPGLAAKPVIDVVLGVPDSADEEAYVPPLQACGFVLRGREPGWHEHRLLRHADPECNLHVFSAGSAEVERMLCFRDRLRSHPAERDAYQAAKFELAARPWTYLQQYADAKGEIVEAIIARADSEG